MPEKGDQFYGYIAQWDGYPFYSPTDIPTQYGSCIVDGNYPSGIETIPIKSTTGTVTAGDNAIIDNVGYLILEYEPDYIRIEPGLLKPVYDGTIVSVIHSTIPPTTFLTEEEIVPKTKLIATIFGNYSEGAASILIAVTAGEPEVEQLLIIGSDQSEQQYNVNAVDPGPDPDQYLLTLDAPGLVFPITNGTYATQTRNQWIEIKERDGEIYEQDIVRLLNYYYEIIDYRSSPMEAVCLATPGAQETIPADTTGRIYH